MTEIRQSCFLSLNLGDILKVYIYIYKSFKAKLQVIKAGNSGDRILNGKFWIAPKVCYTLTCGSIAAVRFILNNF
jgi:hypothetical protein